MSDADYCDCDYDYPPEWWKTTYVKAARKQYRCDECFGPINIGESYKRSVGVFEGEFMSFQECALCGELREWAVISMPCFCAYEIGSLHERVQRMVRDVAAKTPGFFMEYGRRMVKIRARKRAMSGTR